jgi:tetraacyldisaccharide 4'-kinase
MSQSSSARRLLFPLIPFYRLALAWREFRLRSGIEPVRRLRFPVISIGNLSMGGAGKTPLVIALAQALTARGLSVDVLSRGYGRRSKLAARVSHEGSAEDFGDEPLLIARETGAPVYVAAQRYDAGLMAEEEAEQAATRLIHLLDDGFQHRQLARDVEILLINSRDWKDWLLPAGNLREPLEAARRSSVIAIPADELELEAALRVWGWTGPVWRLHRIMELPEITGPVAAFCGIARPEQFFAGLEEAGVEVAARFAFPDHFIYTRAALDELVANAKSAGAKTLITTEKDLARLGKMTEYLAKTMPLAGARLCIKIENQDEAIDWLIARLKQIPNPNRFQ